MFRKTICALGIVALLAFFLPSSHNRASAQDAAKPVDSDDPRLTFSFPIQPGGKPFSFKVELDKTGNVSGVSVSREGETNPFQTLQTCAPATLQEPVTQNWQNYEISMLVSHADLNFDGVEDLELLVYDIPHLDKKLYCIYLWDDKTDHFLYSKELSDLAVNPVPHPENKTISMREDWQGGAWQEDTYSWNNGKLKLIEENSLLGDWSNPNKQKCGFTFTCSRLIKGKMVTTLEKEVCSTEEMFNLPDCPAATSSPPNVPSEKSAISKKN